MAMNLHLPHYLTLCADSVNSKCGYNVSEPLLTWPLKLHDIKENWMRVKSAPGKQHEE